ncbi:RUN and FYVE domain-containing protein 4 isoform X2 [Neopsephotus bourkii]|uniref:RUN and FYVE domain-containing protein 4 isoform X2 n=1 Tax=Neopsephotus bourkii TaxID=309878 RepID=UPI002AA5A999|nr:RUN and FYVE domain-containing protein 4 isoform X2 [Neopsephotus bourkii]
MAGDGELNRIIKDLQRTVAELNHCYRERNLPVTDGSRELHGLCAQLEFLLQFDLKEKKSFFGQRKDYWDFLCQGLAQRRQEHEGIRFVSSLDKLKTPVGRGRAFLRYCLVHRQLAESLQLCLLDPESLREWYYARSPFLSPQHRAEILGILYELDCVTFHLALCRDDLDTAWPMFSETLVRPSLVAGSSLAKTAPQADDADTRMHGWPDGIAHFTTALCKVPVYPCSPTLAALEAGGVEVEDVKGNVEDMEGRKDVEEEDEVEKDEDEEVERDVDVKVEEDVEEEDGKEFEEDEKEMEDEEEVEDMEVNVKKDMEVEEDVEEDDEEELGKDEEEVEEVEVNAKKDVEVEEDVEEDGAEEFEKDEEDLEDVDAEEQEDTQSAGKAPQCDGDRDSGASPPPSTGCVLGSLPPEPRQLGGTEESLWALVSQLRAELEQWKASSRALAARLAREQRRHRRQEEGSARQAQLLAREAEALRDTNTFLGQALAAVVGAGAPGALAQAQEEARVWREVAEEQGAQLAAARAEVAAVSSHLRECQAALAAAAQTDMPKDASASDEVAAVEEVLQWALEIACGPQESLPEQQAEGESRTATSMAMRLATLATAVRKEAWQSQQQLQAKRQEVAQLQEQLSRARQDGERWASALQRAQREALEREATRGAEQARQQELIRDMKGRLLELLRHAPARADLCSPTGRRMPCGRRQRASPPRCPAQHPAMQGCAPTATRISVSSPGGTTAGYARVRYATRALWTWASRGAAACFATSKGTHRVYESGLQPSHWAWNYPCPDCLLSDLLGTRVLRACRLVLLPGFTG